MCNKLKVKTCFKDHRHGILYLRDACADSVNIFYILNENPLVVYNLKSKDMEHMEHESNEQNPSTSWWQLKFNSALIPIASINMVSDENLPFVPTLASLSLFSFIAKSVKLNNIPIFLVVAIVTDGPRWLSRDTFKAGFIQHFLYFLPCQYKYRNMFLNSCIFVMRLTYKA